MKNELISIVMPVKDAALFLQECVDSILSQSEENWELIAVNDHSSDSSFQLLNNYASIDSRVTAVNNKGDGIIDSLQTAYALSKGAYIHRMDADDIMPVQKLTHLKSILQEKGKGWIATGKVNYFAEGGVSDGYQLYANWLNDLCERRTHWVEIYKECVIPSPCWLIHREDFENCGGFSPNRYPEDYDLVFRFYEQQLKVASSNEVLHHWRDHSERTSRNHIHYQHNTFFELKLDYFFKLERDNKRPLVVWGAGSKGKLMAKLLNQRGLDYTWVSNNPKKHGKEIYEQIMQSFEDILTTDNPQVIITVALKNAKNEIIEFLELNGLMPYKDYWFFQ